MTGIVDYGVGNLFSLRSSLAFLGEETVISGDKETLAACERILLPGVGAFEDAARKLRECGLDQFVHETAERGKLVWLFTISILSISNLPLSLSPN